MNNPTLISLVAAACFALTSTVTIAEQDAACPHHNNDGASTCEHKMRCAHGKSPAGLESMRAQFAGLQLSDAQQQEMGALMGIYGPRFKELRERGEADRRALLMAVPDAANYRELSERVSEEAASAAQEAVILLAELQANAYALLSVEQQAEYRRLKAQAEERRQAYMNKASSGKGYSRKARHGCAGTEGALETPPSPPQ